MGGSIPSSPAKEGNMNCKQVAKFFKKNLTYRINKQEDKNNFKAFIEVAEDE